jgi:geranylgeranyl diphosphate synthase type II
MTSTANSLFERALGRLVPRVDRALDRLLPRVTEEPRLLHRAIRYSVFAGGKRLRPALCLLACDSVGGRMADAVPSAAALEMIHTFSLIHDDLPGMDDDDWRRGRRANHVVFGEGTAILAGDALLNLAFQTLARAPLGKVRDVRILWETVGEATGTEGMIGGQALDLLYEGSAVSFARVLAMHRRKTGALLRASLRMGALIGGASPARLRAFHDYGERIGLAFQITDDLLNVRASRRQAGKSVGSDRRKQKATAASRGGVATSERRAARLLEEARGLTTRLGRREAEFASLAETLLHRTR